jgi:hypothetical protein
VAQHPITKLTGGQAPGYDHDSLGSPHRCIGHLGIEAIKLIYEQLCNGLHQVHTQICGQKRKLPIQAPNKD